MKNMVLETTREVPDLSTIKSRNGETEVSKTQMMQRDKGDKMTTVYLLWHAYETTSDADDDKLIGVYSTKGNAQNAVARLRDQPGFRDHQDRFEISEYVLDRDHWTEGFVRVAGDAEIKVHAGRKSIVCRAQ